jgi:integrase
MASFQVRTRANGKSTVTARIRRAGVEETRTFTTKTAAKDWARQREAEIRNAPALAGTEARRHTLADAITRYLENDLPGLAEGTQTKYRQHLEWWRANYGKRTLDTFGPPQISEARDRLGSEVTRRKGQQTGRRRSSSTVNRYLASLAAVLSKAHSDWHWTTVNHMGGVGKKIEPAGRDRWLSYTPDASGTSELDRLLEACRVSESLDLYLAVVLSIGTGGRRMEILGLTWADVDLPAKTVTLSGQKTKYKRTVVLSDEAVELLRQRQGIGRALVFPSPNDPSRPVDLHSAWVTALRRAGIRDFRWHDMRHTCASYLVQGGASLAETAAVLGHRTLLMVSRYAHLSNEKLAAASTKAAARLAGRERP